jgi:hypothetical protein
LIGGCIGIKPLFSYTKKEWWGCVGGSEQDVRGGGGFLQCETWPKKAVFPLPHRNSSNATLRGYVVFVVSCRVFWRVDVQTSRCWRHAGWTQRPICIVTICIWKAMTTIHRQFLALFSTRR